MNAGVTIGLVVVVLLVIMSIILIATSLEKLDSKEIGLQYNTVEKELDDEVYTEGLHTGPPGFEFIIFPNTFTTMSFSNLRCLNSDGVRIALDVSYQYRIKLPYMRETVMDFKDWEGYQKVLRRVGIAVLYESCSEFNTTEFQTKRTEFESELSNLLSIRYDELHSTVEGLQVNDITRPSGYESTIKKKERAFEDIKVARKEQPRLLTEADTILKEANEEAFVIQNKAESEARILSNQAEAEARAIKEQYAKEAEAYESIMGSDGLGFSPEAFISYLGVRVIADAKNPVYIGLNSPAKSSHYKP